MEEKLKTIEARFAELDRLIADPDLHKDQKRAVEVMREHSHLREIVDTSAALRDLRRQLEESRELLEGEEDADLREMAGEEAVRLEEEAGAVEVKLRILLVPPDPLDGKNTILEIRAGTGGDEASLFAADLYRMYTRYAESMGWKTEVIENNETEVGGLKEIIFSISGKEVYSHLKYESGVHRVQRVPTTESSGRIHTSAVTVAVLPEAEETDVTIRQEDLR
ncbi:MAG: PCRF domain-containing protein, partial [Spirochaetales bacterium]|nr:PCRF domain-containing protein [Spirochaetales bacterium]